MVDLHRNCWNCEPQLLPIRLPAIAAYSGVEGMTKAGPVSKNGCCDFPDRHILKSKLFLRFNGVADIS